MATKLDKWFIAAKNQKPLINTNEVETMINLPPVKAKSSTLKSYIIMEISIMLTATIAYYLFAPIVPLNLPFKKTTHQTSLSVSQLQPDSTRTVNRIAFKNAYSLKKEFDFSPAKVISIDTINEIAEEFNYTSARTSAGFTNNEILGEIKINLTNDELKALGIITNGNELFFEITNDSMKALAFRTKSRLDFLFRLKVGASGSRNIVSNKIQDIRFANNEVWPLVVELSADMDSKSEYHALDFGVSSNQELLFAEKIIPHLVPIEVNLKGMGLINAHDNNITFWYKNTESFRKLLPALYRESLEQMPNFDEQKKQQIIDNLNQQRAIKAAATELTDLEKKEVVEKFIFISANKARKLGIRSSTNQLQYKLNLQNTEGKMVKATIFHSDDQIVNYSHRKKTYRSTQNDSIQPLFYTDTAFSEMECYHLPLPNISNQSEIEAKDYETAIHFKKIHSSLIPIVIMPTSPQQTFSPIVLWYYPSKKLMDILQSEQLP